MQIFTAILHGRRNWHCNSGERCNQGLVGLLEQTGRQIEHANQKWYPLTAFVDTAYGTAIYALACMAINSA